ncbi:MAG: tRNA uridine-5-carboxymethylaminomethyl(34) synthesis GTPase MnmE [Gammaproteobacteria bacterium]|nr:tRNA uridine-5-carboxymethylaminomethyl(34) synthesis GTPase MnmE [Gammaproteobacteria bacterium]MDH5653749.1 tRNA uridine-5-carboxymethylaminomethyl(34) synthesis GTPase MnmE [Gammaproteobacteria bacterium]
MTNPFANDTIAALATPPGRGGVGIIRVSGPASREIAEQILGVVPPARRADYLDFLDGEQRIIDSGIALFFQTPHSFTGEDVLELQGHGGPVVMDMLLRRCLELGARMARPGEFSERAFLNDKLDLAQAEAIADLIEAGSEQAARGALQSLQGVFSAGINTLVEQLTELRMFVEAAIDFPEEEIDFLADERIGQRLQIIYQQVVDILQEAQQGALLREGMHVVLAGRPNAGKSSLLNALAGRESAIVTDIPGTTRDVLREEIHIDGMPLHIIDTAGLRESEDIVEQEGIKRTWQAIEQADQVLLLIDDTTGLRDEEQRIQTKLPPRLPVTFVHNKIDLSGNKAELLEHEYGTMVRLSAKTGDGISLLRGHLKTIMGYTGTGEGKFIARRRHLDALQRALHQLDNARAQLETHTGELLAEDLRQAQQALGEITGHLSSDELLGKIFSSFCIGK